jgi:hypothetical protein
VIREWDEFQSLLHSSPHMESAGVYPPRFISILLAPSHRNTTAVVKRTLDPSFPAESSTFDYPLYLSLAGLVGGRGLEFVVWDKVSWFQSIALEAVANPARTSCAKSTWGRWQSRSRNGSPMASVVCGTRIFRWVLPE